MAERRLRKELEEIMKSPPPNCTAKPVNDNNLFLWTGIIEGPPDTPYEGGKFKLRMKFPKDYPFSPPKVVFLTKVYHPNITKDGLICLDTLNKQWSAALTVGKVLLSIMSLLSDPNPNDPLDTKIAYQFKRNYDAFVRNAKEWTKKYAIENENNQDENFIKSSSIFMSRRQTHPRLRMLLRRGNRHTNDNGSVDLAQTDISGSSQDNQSNHSSPENMSGASAEGSVSTDEMLTSSEERFINQSIIQHPIRQHPRFHEVSRRPDDASNDGASNDDTSNNEISNERMSNDENDRESNASS